MTAYRILLAIDVLALVLIVFFFLWGISDGSVSSFNIALWLGLLAAPGGVVLGGVALHRRGRTAPAKALLTLLAVPAALAGLFFLLLIIINPRWH